MSISVEKVRIDRGHYFPLTELPAVDRELAAPVRGAVRSGVPGALLTS